jgi:hypothetical protein
LFAKGKAMKKLLVALAMGFFMLTTVGEAYAISLVYHPINGQLKGINEVDINDTFYDATFYNQWSLSGGETYSGDFALDASNALRSLFTTLPTSTILAPYFPALDQEHIWGCENEGGCSFLTAAFASGSGATATKRGYVYTLPSTVVDSGYRTYDQDDTTIWVQWTESPVGAIPEPETYAMLLAGLGLLGWHARRRKNKQAT